MATNPDPIITQQQIDKSRQSYIYKQAYNDTMAFGRDNGFTINEIEATTQNVAGFEPGDTFDCADGRSIVKGNGERRPTIQVFGATFGIATMLRSHANTTEGIIAACELIKKEDLVPTIHGDSKDVAHCGFWGLLSLGKLEGYVQPTYSYQEANTILENQGGVHTTVVREHVENHATIIVLPGLKELNNEVSSFGIHAGLVYKLNQSGKIDISKFHDMNKKVLDHFGIKELTIIK